MKQEEFLQMYSKINTPTTKKLSGIAKNFTIIIVGLIFVVGVFGSFEVAKFAMPNYIAFLDSFKWFVSPLILSVGAGGVVKNLKKQPVTQVDNEIVFEDEVVPTKTRTSKKSQETPWVELQSQ